ncbi:hypothetical protein V8F20_000885 [Naviculisporaceae sp. PSN 640]
MKTARKSSMLTRLYTVLGYPARHHHHFNDVNTRKTPREIKVRTKEPQKLSLHILTNLCKDIQSLKLPASTVSHETRATRDVNGIDCNKTGGLVADRAEAEGYTPLIKSLPVAAPRASQTATQPQKMDSSQQSPTQSNEGRSYEQYQGISSPGHALQDEDPPNVFDCVPDSPRNEKDSAADIAGEPIDSDQVDHPGTNKTASSLADDSGPVNFSNLLKNRAMETQPPIITHLPETPAAPSNPFRQGRSQLLPTSQLFAATQFSSAVKLASPTSSRPSPNNLQQNSISPNPIMSSPLKSRGLRSTPFANHTSSPQIPPATTSPTCRGRSSSPIRTKSSGNQVIPGSSNPDQPRKRSLPEPMAEYEPMRKSQERRSTSEHRSDPAGVEQEDDTDDSIVRKRKAKSKKEAALRQLTAISFVPPRSDDVEVPSSNRRKARNTRKAKLVRGQSDILETIIDSQGKPDKSGHGAIPGDEEATQSDIEEENQEERPEPIPTEAQDIQLPDTLVLDQTTVLLAPGQEFDENAIPETSPTERQIGVLGNGRMSPPPLPLAKLQSTTVFQSSPPDLGAKLQRTSDSTRSVESTSSPLTNPSPTTPPLPAAVTPVTDQSVLGEQPPMEKGVSDSSPVLVKGKRRQGLSRAKLGSTESLRQSARSRRYSSSADELASNTSRAGTPTFEQSLRISRLSTSKFGRSITRPQQTHQNSGLFEGMAFAISFQSRHAGESNDRYNTRIEFSSSLERRIKQAGGRILHNGFDELFETFPAKAGPASPGAGARIESEISLTAAGKTTGFTALIADGHSRKVKYMQALALGLPCIATRWITSCLDKNQLVDWAPYLLCAGQSAFLGDAIRSRNLTPYDARTAKLVDIVDQRAKLLKGSRILLVMKKATEGKKMAYVFLARVLGASLSRVYSVEEGKAELKAAQDSGRPFDWVYVDGKSDHVDLFASPAAPSGAEKRKRKRASTAAAPVTEQEPPSKKIRTLSDELVIQSLILGRMIEEGELEE